MSHGAVKLENIFRFIALTSRINELQMNLNRKDKVGSGERVYFVRTEDGGLAVCGYPWLLFFFFI